MLLLSLLCADRRYLSHLHHDSRVDIAGVFFLFRWLAVPPDIHRFQNRRMFTASLQID